MRTTTLSAIAIFAVAAIAAADPATPDFSWAGGDGFIADLAFSPDGKQLAVFSDEGTVTLWDVASRKAVGVMKEVINGQNQVRFTPDGKTLLALDRNDGIARLNTSDGKVLPPLPLKSVGGSMTAFDVAPDGKTIAIVGRGCLRIISLSDGSELQNWVVHEMYGINAVACSPDGKYVATAGTDHKADVVDPATGKIPLQFDTHLNGKFAAFSKDSSRLLVSNSDGSLQSLDLTSGSITDLGNDRLTVLAALPSADGKRVYIANGGNGPAVLTPGSTEADTSAFKSDVLIKSIALSPDGTLLAGGAQDGTICLWKLSK